jgi:hypothetical protein
MDPVLVTEDPDLKDVLDKVDWVGAKLGGSFKLHPCRQNPTRVSFDWKIREKHCSKSFKFSKYGGKDQAYAAAEEYQRAVCYREGLTTNNYGFYNNSNGEEIGIVKLTQGKFMFFSRQHLPHVLAHTWYAMKPKDTNCWYCSSSIKDGDSWKGVRFHSLVLPEAKMIDHIDHNGLNNRIENLRPTTPHLNCLNTRLWKKSTSGHKGISLIVKKRSGLRYWQASVMIHGKSIGKQFSVNVLGEDGAKNAALTYRDQLFEKYGVFKG